MRGISLNNSVKVSNVYFLVINGTTNLYLKGVFESREEAENAMKTIDPLYSPRIYENELPDNVLYG